MHYFQYHVQYYFLSCLILSLADNEHIEEEGDQTVPLSVSPEHKDADTQWEDPTLMDHNYTGEKRKQRETQCGGEEPLLVPS